MDKEPEIPKIKSPEDFGKAMDALALTDQVFIRSDLDEIRDNTAYYRLDGNMRDFLNRCLQKHGDIQGVILTKRISANLYDWNIGFVLGPEIKKEPAGTRMKDYKQRKQ